MKSTAIASVVAAASLGFASLAQAQNPNNVPLRPVPQYQQQPQPQHFDHRGHGPRQVQRQGFARHDQRQFNNGHRYYQAQGHRYYSGGYVPPQYRGQGYVVNDWRNRHLQAPPQGYQWVRSQDNTNYALIAIATGLIASIVLSQ